MFSSRIGHISTVAIGALMIWAGPAIGQLSATATIQGIQNGGNYDYTIKLNNTGTSSIGTFWFAWTPPGAPVEYDFLPTPPSTAAGPTGWIGGISPGFPGTSIEYYNSTGNSIGQGQIGTFTFTSTDTPATLQNGRAFGIFPFTESFIYTATPPTDLSAPPSGTPARVDPVFVVPEPSSLFLGALSCVFLAARRRAA